MQFTQLGPYRVVKRLGRGGMGTVFQAINDETGETVAVKVLATALSDDRDSRQRFNAEIESLKLLDHPNIVRLLGYGEQDGHAYYVMEYVAGTTLEHELQAGRRFNWREVTELGVKLCRALRHAHDRGVIHRDLKPANLLLTSSGDVKLSDFGIARLFGMTGLTSHGSIVGTAEYMAPEQAEGRPVSPLSDLYSLGCVMFTLLAGRTPFRSASVPEVLQQQRYVVAPPVSKYAQYVPADLEQIIAQLLEKDPKDRVPNALVLGRRLEALEVVPAEFEPDDTLSGPNGGQGIVSGGDSGSGRGALTPDPLARTRGMDSDIASPPAGEVTPADNAPAGEAAVLAERVPIRRAVTRHVTVESTGLPAEEPAASRRGQQWLQVLAPAAGLLIILATVWYLARPLSADQLFARIESIVAEHRSSDPLDAEEYSHDFLNRFPDDPRAAKVRGYLTDIEMNRLDRRLRSLAARPGSEDNLTSVEADMVMAIRMSDTRPDQALAKFQALVTLYDTTTDPPLARQCVELARRRVAKLQDQVAQSTAERLAWLNAQLEKADAEAPSHPAAARGVWKGIVDLYGDQPWAAEPVRRARAALSGTPSAPLTPTNP